jgi:ferredoxin
LWAARTLAQELGNTELVSLGAWDTKKHVIDSPVIGLIFPVHIWGVPHRILKFLDELKAMSPDYIFAIANNGGQVANTLVQLKKTMASKGLVLAGGWSIEMPSNYIPWGGPGSQEEQEKLFQGAHTKLSAIAGDVRNRVRMPVEKGPLWQRLVFTPVYKLTFPIVHKMDGKFWTDERCNQCSLCVKICPNQNISIQNGILSWHNNCEQCLACLQWCPQEALQYGPKTSAYPRYHHPEVKLKDL